MMRRLLVVAVVALTGAVPLTLSAPRVAASQTLTVTAQADTYVAADTPTTVRGSSTKLYVDRTPIRRTYLRFSVSGLGAGVAASAATLRIYAMSSLAAGFDVRTSTATWSESTLTYANEPTTAMSPVLATSPAATSGQWVSVALPSSVRITDGTTTLVLSARSDTALALASRETAQPPALAVTYDASGTQPPPPTAYPTVAAAGDIACDPLKSTYNGGAGTADNCHMRATSDLLVSKGYTAVLALGDNQNYCGSAAAYRQSYDPTWGRVKGITHPVPGNHEYLTSGDPASTTGCNATNAGAAGYFGYFGSAAGAAGQGWYSFDLGTWHVIALNSNCGDAGGCGPTSPQGMWLAADLKAHPAQCTLAYWHIPLFSSGGRASPNSRPFWNAMYAAGVEAVLDGHDHIYERFAPMTPTGTLDQSKGIREFIVGTGGENHTSIATVAANSVVRNATTYGVLQLTLKPGSYDWKFVPEAGKTFTDSGSATCH